MNWIELTDTEYRKAWDLFENKFSFFPSTKADDWPSITVLEEKFITFSLTVTWDAKSDYEERCRHVFKSLIYRDEYIFALDWQHECFWFNPHLPNGEREWTIPFYPNGDYCIFFPKDLRWCYFAHPWENSVTLINKDLIQEFANNKPAIFGNIIRRG
ncbi:MULTISPECIES: DUF2716 domain-containing protein [Paenibacillus]|uniref:DUF2716 domain-containing protein n=1 Tax=Paenibacillus TaxID=44249 RepID=UPI00096E3797|nr:DUF2716 domain-containing protein [Paenibacillus odorifer]OME45314.1 hypothetical protein BSK59_32965 [Paenibacillus odorifer]OZQ74697.1 hypothetical protein CA596_16290 [Paenibacillus odorifer]